MSERAASVALRFAFALAALLVVRDLAQSSYAGSPYYVDNSLVYRLFAASRAAILVVAAPMIAGTSKDAKSRPFGIGLLGLALVNAWFTLSSESPWFWAAAVLSYGGMALALAALVRRVGTVVAPRMKATLTVGAFAVGAFLFVTGFANPFFVWGPSYRPDLAYAGNTAYWVGQIVVLTALVGRALRAYRAKIGLTRDDALLVVAFTVLAVGTVLHGTTRLASSFTPIRLAGEASDAIGQLAFAGILGVVVYADPFPTLRSALRWLGFTSLVAGTMPLIEAQIHEMLKQLAVERIIPLDATQAGAVVTVALGLGFRRLDKLWESFMAKDDAVQETSGTAGPAT